MTIMDAWGFQSRAVSSLPVSQKFEDNFIVSTNKLPDSEQYLAILENKLQKLRNDPNILHQLAEKREACMRELLKVDHQADNDDDEFDLPVTSSDILRTIAPQKQALNRGEIVELVKYDQLAEE